MRSPARVARKYLLPGCLASCAFLTTAASSPVFKLEEDLQTRMGYPFVYFQKGRRFFDPNYIMNDDYCALEACGTHRLMSFIFDKGSFFKVTSTYTGNNPEAHSAIYELHFEGTALGMVVHHPDSVTLRLACYQRATALSRIDIARHLKGWMSVAD